MRQIDWDKVEAKQDGEFKRMKPGGYILTIIEAKDQEDFERLNLNTTLPKVSSQVTTWTGIPVMAGHCRTSSVLTAIMLKGTSRAFWRTWINPILDSAGKPGGRTEPNRKL